MDEVEGQPPDDAPEPTLPVVDPEISEETLEYARELLKATREELVRADTKAALLLAGAGIAVGALLNGLLGGRWSPLLLSDYIQWLWWLGVINAVSGLVSLASAIYPRTRRVGAKPALVAFYGDVVLLQRNELPAVMAASSHNVNDALLDQVYQVSLIVARKYQLLRWGLWFFAAAVVLIVVAVLVDVVISFDAVAGGPADSIAETSSDIQ